MQPSKPSPGILLTPPLAALSASTSTDFFRRLAESGILLPNSQDVACYAAEHGELAQLVPTICAEVREALGSEVELSLEIYQDPEINDRYVTLYVRKQTYEPDIFDRLQAISERFSDRLDQVPGYFLLTTDFSRPRENHAI